MTGARVPRVTIGLPVFNGEPFLAQAIESILAQSYDDFELVISDNASTDDSFEICRQYADRDPRIRLSRNETNEGASANFNRVFRCARGEYFRWAAADDMLAPSCVERCVSALDADCGVVLAHTDVRFVDERGVTLQVYRYAHDHAGSADPARRFRDVMRLDRWCGELFGLVRSAVLAETRLLAPYVASDRILRAEVALRGRYAIIGEPLLSIREHPGRSVRALPAHHLRGAWFDPDLKGKRLFPHWRILGEYLTCVRRAPLDRSTRWRCLLHVPTWLGIHANWARMIADVVIAVFPGSWERLARAGRAVGGSTRPSDEARS